MQHNVVKQEEAMGKQQQSKQYRQRQYPQPGPKLYSFRVEEWLLPEQAKSQRERVLVGTPVVISATTGPAAASHYARSKHIPEALWRDGSMRPRIVLRVTSLDRE